MQDKIRRLVKEYQWIILIGIFISAPLIAGHFLSGHDAFYHLANIIDKQESILNGNFSKI